MNSVTCELEEFQTEAVLGPLLAAQEAVSRLDERARRSPYRAAWMQRLLFHEACACQLFEGDLVHLEDLVLLDGHAFSGAPSMALSSALEILRLWRAAEKGDASSALKAPRPGLTGAGPLAESGGEAADEDAPTCSAGHLEAWRRVEAEARTQPPLIAAALVWDAWLSLLPESRSAWRATLLAALTLKSRGLTPNLLLPLDIGWRVSKYRRRPGQNLATRIGGFLGWAEAAAAEGHKEFDSLALAEGTPALEPARPAFELADAGACRVAAGAAFRFGGARGKGAGDLAAGGAHHAEAYRQPGSQAHGPRTLQRMERDRLGGAISGRVDARRAMAWLFAGHSRRSCSSSSATKFIRAVWSILKGSSTSCARMR